MSPWGPEDEIGRLNLMTATSRAQVLARVEGGTVYDLSVEYFIGMPGWHAAGDPHYQIWMTHTPRGTAVDDPMEVGHVQNAHVGYTGSAISMYSHTGTHIDALNHFGLDGRIWNGFEADRYLGDRGWTRTGAETIPPIIARGVLLDVAGALGLDMLPAGYRIRRQDIERTLAAQDSELQSGDVVLIRTGRMQKYSDAGAYMDAAPGLSLEAARFLVEQGGAMTLGADNLSFESFPSEDAENYVPVHTYLLAQQGAHILELVNLEQLARDRVHEFAFIGAPLKLRGADAAPLRPLALPLRKAAHPASHLNKDEGATTMRPGTAHLRVARPTDDIEAHLRFYGDGLGLPVLYRFEDHDQFDGVMLGVPGQGYHLEITRHHTHSAGRAPTQDNLLVFYIADRAQFEAAVHRMQQAGFPPVKSFNPYWDRNGRTFEDPDGYRVVIQNTAAPAWEALP